MADLVEHQVKRLLADEGVLLPESIALDRTSRVRADLCGHWPEGVAVKAQVAVSSRMKKGLVRIARRPGSVAGSVRAVRAALKRLGLAGEVLLERRVPHQREYYLAVLSDPESRGPAVVFSPSGGVEVERSLGRSRDKHKLAFEIDRIPAPEALERFFSTAAAVDAADVPRLSDLARRMIRVYRKWHCKLLEVNPVAPTPEGLIALDGKASLDEDAVSGLSAELEARIGRLAVSDRSTIYERAAARIDASDYRGSAHFMQADVAAVKRRLGRKLRAFVGFDGVGTGVSLVAMDELVRLGYYPRNFCDTSGNPPASKLYRATRIILAQKDLRGYFFISCMSSQQLHHTARGILKAFKEAFPRTDGVPPYPALFVFRGAWDTEALELLREHGLGAAEHVVLLGRETSEREAALRFDRVYREFYGR